MKKISKAVVLCAGRGSRLGALTNALPKPMLPLGEKPALQLILEELAAAQITHVLLIIGFKGEIIKNYFNNLHSTFKTLHNLKIYYKKQDTLNGTGGALMLARQFVGADDFLLIFPDDITKNTDNICNKLLNTYKIHKQNLMASRIVEKENINKFGIIFGVQKRFKLAQNHINKAKINAKNVKKSKKTQKNRIFSQKRNNNHILPIIKSAVISVEKIIEKPKESTSQLVNFGRYIFTPEIFDKLENLQPQPNGEIYLTDALNLLAQENKLLTKKITCPVYDLGSIDGYRRAFSEFSHTSKTKN